MWHELGVLYGAAFTFSLVFSATSYGLARAVGASVTKIAVSSPVVLWLRKAAPAVGVGPWPGGYVQFEGRGAGDDQEPTAPGDWRRLGLGARLLVTLGPWLILFGLAVACLGPAHALRSVAHGVGQMVLPVDMTPLVRGFLSLVDTAPVSTTFGIFLAKSVALNLLPSGGLAGGAAIQEAFGPRVAKPLSTWLLVSMPVVTLWMAGRMGWAILQVLRG